MEFAPIPQTLLDHSKPLLWNTYNNSGWLFARENTILNTLELPLGIPKQLFFEAKFANPHALSYYHLVLCHPDHSSSLNHILHLDSWNESDLQHQTLFLHESDTFSQTTSALSILHNTLSSFRPSPLWAASIYRISQQWATLCKISPAQTQLALAHLNHYAPPHLKPALNALSHAFLTIRTAQLSPRISDDLPNPSNELLTSITCACLTYNLHSFASPLTTDALAPHETSKLTLNLLQSCLIKDPNWLFIIREQHTDWLVKYRSISHIFVHNEIARFTSQVAYHNAPLASATALTTLSITQSPRNSSTSISDIARVLLRSIGSPPIGSLFLLEQGLALSLTPSTLVLLTTPSLSPLPQFKELPSDPQRIKTLKIFEPTPSQLSNLSDTLLCATQAYTQKASYS